MRHKWALARLWSLLAAAALTIPWGVAQGSVPEDPALWAARYNSPWNSDDSVAALAVSPDGSKVFVTGNSYSYGSGLGSRYDYATVAYSASSGAELWTARYNGPGNDSDSAHSLAVSPDGSNVFVTGRSVGSGSGYDYATVAYSASSGAQLWAARYNGPGNDSDSAHSLAVSPDGSNVFVTGGSRGLGSDYIDYATVAYSASRGVQLWTARFNGRVDSYDSAVSLAVSPDGSKVLVTGVSYGGYPTVAYSASSGTQLWAARYNGSATSLAVSPDGSTVFVTGDSYDPGSYSDYATVAYSASSGTQLWVARYNGPGNDYDYAHSLAVTPDGSKVFVTGRSVGSSGRYNYNDYATAAYSASSGAQLWATRYNGPGNDYDSAHSLAVSPDGSQVFVTGESEGSGSYSDYATIAYRSSSCAAGWSEDGPVSAPVHEGVEPQSGPAAPYVHGVNCDIVAGNGL